MKGKQINLDPNNVFALFRLPAEKDHYLFLNEYNTTASASYDSDKTGFIFHPFDQLSKHKALYFNADHIIKNANINFISELKVLEESTRKDSYLDLANTFIKACHGQFKKIVLSRIKQVSNNEEDLFKTFCKIKDTYPNAFVYLFNHPSSGTWLGASPELFLDLENNEVKTIALAGTKLNNKDGKSIAWTSKEIEEQALVSNYIENILKKHDITYKMEGPGDHEAGKLLHLKTSFSFNYQDKLETLISDLHPTPAVCGIPKNKAKDFILQHEAHDRKYYTGYLGPTNFNGKSSLFVNLRCMELSSEHIVLYLGGGILAASDPEKEWMETEAKASTLLDILSK